MTDTVRSPLEGLAAQIGHDVHHILTLGEQLIAAFATYDDKRGKLAAQGLEVNAAFQAPINSAFSAWAQLRKEPGKP